MTRKKPFNSRKSKKEVKDLIKKWEECLKVESNRSSWNKGDIKKSQERSPIPPSEYLGNLLSVTVAAVTTKEIVGNYFVTIVVGKDTP